jgi:hypothetical protein
LLPLFVTGADPDISGTVDQIVNMTTEAGDYVSAGVSSDKSFIIIIETAAPIEVQLFNGNNFTITQAQATAYLGKQYPAKLLKVYKTGTTGTFSAVL